MRRLLFAVTILALLGLGAKVGSKDIASGMVITYENQTCGYECDLNDGYLGPDENLAWQAAGTLEPGESFTYTYLPSKDARYIHARAGTYRGRYVPLQVDIETAFGSDSGIGEACVVFYWSGAVTDWSVTVTNVGDVLARRAYASGENQMEMGQTCP